MKLRPSSPRKNWTFAQRLKFEAIWWGVPMLLLELIGASRRLWVGILLIAIPVYALMVLCSAGLEHLFFSDRADSSRPQNGGV